MTETWSALTDLSCTMHRELLKCLWVLYSLVNQMILSVKVMNLYLVSQTIWLMNGWWMIFRGLRLMRVLCKYIDWWIMLTHWLSVNTSYCQSKIMFQKSNKGFFFIFNTSYYQSKANSQKSINADWLPIKSKLFRKVMMSRQSVTASTERMMQGESQLRFACF